MLELPNREMNKISKFLFFGLCIGICGAALANVATTAGSNLTAYNGGASTNNNNWNTMSNSRSGAAAPATANFGNCNAVILRCASPKCSGGGCSDMTVARSIVGGCVASNESCKKHGDDLVDAIAAQIVAQSTAAANAQMAAAAQAQSNAQVEQMQMQMQQMQQAMQDSMNSMQAQMEQQNAAAAQQLESALAEQRQVMEAAQAAAAESATNAVATAGMEGMTVAEQVAAKNNMDVDVLVRSQSLGEIETEIENATKKMDDLKKVLARLLEYGGCDSSANHCEGPKRVKKFKDIANEFFDPYDGVADAMYDSMMHAMALGVDISQVVMMLSDSCNMWGKYMCDVCPSNSSVGCLEVGGKFYYAVETYKEGDAGNDGSKTGKVKPNQPHCRLVEILTDGATVQREWIDANSGLTGNVQVACATDTLGNVGIFKRRSKMNSVIDIETVRNLINQDANEICKESHKNTCLGYCRISKNSGDGYTNLKTAVKNKKFNKNATCKSYNPNQDTLLNVSKDTAIFPDECDYFPPEYALCSVHAYNIGKIKLESGDVADMKEVIGYKTTFIAQLIKQQYDALNTMVKQLKTHLRKAILTTKTEIATGNVSGGSGGSASSAKQDGIYLAGAQNCKMVNGAEAAAAQCLQSNASLIINASNKTDARKQLEEDLAAAKLWKLCPGTNHDECCDKSKQNDPKACAQDLRVNVSVVLQQIEAERNSRRYSGY